MEAKSQLKGSVEIKPLHKHENIIHIIEGVGYLFFNTLDQIVRFRSTLQHDDHLESKNFVEPAKPILNGRN